VENASIRIRLVCTDKLQLCETKMTVVDETDETTAIHLQPTKRMEVEDVVIHPLVLLSAADHYHRVAKNTRKRVVGVLLGQVSKGKVDITNSYAVPFEENHNNPVRATRRDGRSLHGYLYLILV
jgi:hypothetical protein